MSGRAAARWGSPAGTRADRPSMPPRRKTTTSVPPDGCAAKDTRTPPRPVPRASPAAPAPTSSRRRLRPRGSSPSRSTPWSGWSHRRSRRDRRSGGGAGAVVTAVTSAEREVRRVEHEGHDLEQVAVRRRRRRGRRVAAEDLDEGLAVLGAEGLDAEPAAQAVDQLADRAGRPALDEAERVGLRQAVVPPADEGPVDVPQLDRRAGRPPGGVDVRVA